MIIRRKIPDIYSMEMTKLLTGNSESTVIKNFIFNDIELEHRLCDFFEIETIANVDDVKVNNIKVYDKECYIISNVYSDKAITIPKESFNLQLLDIILDFECAAFTSEEKCKNSKYASFAYLKNSDIYKVIVNKLVETESINHIFFCAKVLSSFINKNNEAVARQFVLGDAFNEFSNSLNELKSSDGISANDLLVKNKKSPIRKMLDFVLNRLEVEYEGYKRMGGDLSYV